MGDARREDPEGALPSSLVREHVVLSRHLASVQRRCTQLIQEQAAELAGVRHELRDCRALLAQREATIAFLLAKLAATRARGGAEPCAP
jgi:hypothetical protein